MKKQTLSAVIVFILMSLLACGCALINTAIGAGIAYGIYQATSK